MQNTLRKGFPEQALALSGPVSVRAYSEIFHAVFNAEAPFEAAVKHCLHPKTGQPDVLAAIEQFTALQRVDQAFKPGPAHFRVPAPHCIAPRLGIFSMSWVEGESLSNRLRHPRAWLQGPGWFEAVGAWLGYFHQAGPVQTQRISQDEQRLDAAGNSALAVPEKTFVQAAKNLASWTHALVDAHVTVSWLHGDCKADNFILNDRDVYGIDFSLLQENAIEYDLAMFLNNLDFLLYSPRLLPLWPLKSQFVKAFLAGYRATGPAVSPLYLQWVRLNFLLWQWQTSFHAGSAGTRTWVMHKIHSKMAADLSAQLTAMHSAKSP